MGLYIYIYKGEEHACCGPTLGSASPDPLKTRGFGAASSALPIAGPE